MTASPLRYDFTFDDLYAREGLIRLDQIFLQFLVENESKVHERLCYLRSCSSAPVGKDLSTFLLTLAPWIEKFLGHFSK